VVTSSTAAREVAEILSRWEESPRTGTAGEASNPTDRRLAHRSDEAPERWRRAGTRVSGSAGGDDEPGRLQSVSPDIEIAEEDTSAERITRPFDPNQIRVKLWTPTVDLVLRRLQQGEIDLAPDFQRAAGIWKDKAQSQLIESLLIRIPLPAFYVDSSNEDCLVVVDGIQRLTALKRFVLDGELSLEGLEYLTELTNKRFKELSRPLQRRIEETMLTVYLIDKGTPDEAKLNIFKRLNTGGASRSRPRRSAMNPGPARGFLRELAESPEFRSATQGKFNDRRMTDRECALRYCAFVLTAPDSYPADGDLGSFLHDAMKAINAQTDRKRLDRPPFAGEFFYLAAGRVGPRVSAEVSDHRVRARRELGSRGEFAAHFLAVHGRESTVLSALHHPNAVSDTLVDQVEAWLGEVSPGAHLHVGEHRDLDAVQIRYSFAGTATTCSTASGSRGARRHAGARADVRSARQARCARAASRRSAAHFRGLTRRRAPGLAQGAPAPRRARQP
jgi:Protein of unknown function DUF262